MTPEQIAALYVDRANREAAQDMIEQAISAARAQERERCAGIADIEATTGVEDGEIWIAARIAKAIRALPEETGNG